MLRLPRFQYVAPRSVDEAAALLAEHGPTSMVVAGGTDLYPNMKRRQQEPALVIGLRAIPELHGIRANDGMLQVGATTTLHAVASHPLVRDRYPALATAAGLVSTPHLRRMGTLGGNLCLDTRCTYYDQNYHWRKSIDFCMKKDGAICWVAPNSPRCWAVSSSDTAPVAVALRARLRLVSAAGERSVEAGDFFRDDGIEYLSRRPDEILTSVAFPGHAGWRMTYEKLRRRGSFDFPILGVAAAVKLADGLVRASDGSVRLADGLARAEDGAPALVDGAGRLSTEGMSKLIGAGEDTAQDYGKLYATIEAGAERADAEKMAYGAPADATGMTAYTYVMLGDDGETGRNLTRGLAALGLLGVGGGAFFLRRRLI